MVNADNLQNTLDSKREYIETRLQTLAKIHADESSSYKMLLLGVLLGLLGGLFATLLYEVIIASLPEWGKGAILVVTTILFALFIVIFARDMKKARDKVLQVKNDRDKIMSLLESLEKRLPNKRN